MRIVIAGNGHAGDRGSRAGDLEQALADLGLDWTVEHIDDTTQAGAIPDDRVVDVFVAPLRHAELLSRTRAQRPDAVRVVLLERGDDAAAPQALDVAHRMLNTPLDASELIEAVDSVVELRALLDNSELKHAIGKVESLPPPPRVYIELTQLLRDPEASLSEVADVLGQDPAVAAKVLRLCNSAYFSGGRAVSDLRAAATRLGFQALRRLVLATETFGSVRSSVSIDREAMQDRALRTSKLAARLLGGSSAELAATAGLLAEIGRLLPGVRADEDGEGAHYAEAGAYLLGLWGLPMPIVEAVAYHRAPSRLRSTGFWVTGAVHVAAALVDGSAVDEEYLRSVGMLDRLPKWRSLAEQLADAA